MTFKRLFMIKPMILFYPPKSNNFCMKLCSVKYSCKLFLRYALSHFNRLILYIYRVYKKCFQNILEGNEQRRKFKYKMCRLTEERLMMTSFNVEVKIRCHFEINLKFSNGNPDFLIFD